MYIVANHGAVLNVQLGASDFIVFKDVTICHSGMSLPAKFKENAPNDPKYCMEGSAKAIREFEINEHSDCCVMVHSGGVLLRNCTLTLKSHQNNLKSRLPAIVALPRTFINLTSCKVLGHDQNHNGGCILINSDAFISDCSFEDFTSGAIFCIAKPDNVVSIQDSQITNCSVNGIYL